MSDRPESEFDELMQVLADAATERTRVEELRSRFRDAWRESPRGFASVVADSIQYGKRDPLALASTKVLAGHHLRDDDPPATNATGRGWLVVVEGEEGVRHHRFESPSAAVSFAQSIEDGQIVGGSTHGLDERTRTIVVEKRAISRPGSRAPAPAHEAAA